MPYDEPFTARAGRNTDAVEYLVANSALRWLVTTERHPSGALHVTAPKHASTGEGLLWCLAKDVGGAPGLPVSIFDLAERLDGTNVAAAHVAIGILLGVIPTPPVAPTLQEVCS